jgi:hypothetical protein
VVARKFVDGRDKPGHDERRERSSIIVPIITDRIDEILIALLIVAACDLKRLSVCLRHEPPRVHVGRSALAAAALSR